MQRVNVFFYLQQKERLKSGKKTLSDTELIHDEIDKEVSFCTCRNPLRVEMVDEGKYRVSESLFLHVRSGVSVVFTHMR